MKLKKWHVISCLIIGVPVISGLIIAGLYGVWKIGMQQPESSIRDAIPTFVEATVEVPIDKAVIIGMDSGSLTFHPGELSLFIPANALNGNGQFSFTPKEADLLSDAGDPGWRRPYVYNIEFQDPQGVELDPSVNSFVEVCFMLDDGSWANYQALPDWFHIQIYDESQNPPQWKSLEMSVYPYRQQLCGITTHFSLFSLALKEPPTPTPEPSATEQITETETPGIYEP